MAEKEIYGFWKLSTVRHLHRALHCQNVTIDILWEGLDYLKFYKNKKEMKHYTKTQDQEGTICCKQRPNENGEWIIRL